ncbi:MAG: hypothetical protein KAS32_12050 [Candidatus Peribacteraceae bacterium]|nr:hypothetical protein [Candidatus Peribacteraceae bacterium]
MLRFVTGLGVAVITSALAFSVVDEITKGKLTKSICALTESITEKIDKL